jgi:LmbE family N-acetylglucosaminyl deacetylase
MEDHMNTCRLAVTAAFARGMPNFPTSPPAPHVEQDVTVYHAQPHGNCDPLGNPIRPTLCVDVGAVLDEKTAMLACHKSQKNWLDQSQGLDSYLHTMRDLMRDVGRLSGRYEYAEGWRRHLHLGFCPAEADPLAEALKAHCVQLKTS